MNVFQVTVPKQHPLQGGKEHCCTTGQAARAPQLVGRLLDEHHRPIEQADGGIVTRTDYVFTRCSGGTTPAPQRDCPPPTRPAESSRSSTSRTPTPNAASTNSYTSQGY
jgi:hypothetical protein